MAASAAEAPSVTRMADGGYRVIAVGNAGTDPDRVELAMLHQAAVRTLEDGKGYFRLVRADFRNRPDPSGRPARMVVGEIRPCAERQPGLERVFDAQEVVAKLGPRLAN